MICRSPTPSFARLLDIRTSETFSLLSPTRRRALLPGDEATVIQEALRNRPELISQRLSVSSAKSYATAERDLSLPTISASAPRD